MNGVRQGAFPDRRGSVHDAGAQSPSCGTLYGSDGPVAPYQWSCISRANPGLLMQFVHGLRGLLPGCPAVMNCYYLKCRSEMYIRTQILSK